jgi:hypothetical protein
MKHRNKQETPTNPVESEMSRGLRLGSAALWGDPKMNEIIRQRHNYRLAHSVAVNVHKLHELQPRSEHSEGLGLVQSLQHQLEQHIPGANQQPHVTARMPVQSWGTFGEAAAILTQHRISDRTSLFPYLFKPEVEEQLDPNGNFTLRRVYDVLKVDLHTAKAGVRPPELAAYEASVAKGISVPVLATEQQREGKAYHLILPFSQQSSLTLSVSEMAGSTGRIIMPTDIAITVANPYA